MSAFFELWPETVGILGSFDIQGPKVLAPEDQVKHILSAIALSFVMTPASADDHLGSGDPEAGAAVFKKCQSCHVVRDDDGTTLAGKRGKSGPNLYGVVGRTAGTLEGFRYKKSIVKAGEGGLVWDAEQIAELL